MDTTASAALFGAVGAVVGAGLTTLGSYLNGRLIARSTERQLTAAAREAEAVRAAALAEAWRAERHETYRQLLALIAGWERDPQWLEGNNTLNAKATETWMKLDQTVADARLVGSAGAGQAADALVTAAAKYGAAVLLADHSGHFVEGTDAYTPDGEKAHRCWLDLKEATVAFRREARLDLGTER